METIGQATTCIVIVAFIIGLFVLAVSNFVVSSAILALILLGTVVVTGFFVHHITKDNL